MEATNTSRYRLYKDKKFLVALLFSFVILLASLFISYYAGIYATEKASSPVTDIILSNTRVYDVDSIFVYGAILFWVFVSFICFRDPQKLIFTLKSIALFVIIRSIFISLTHIAPFPTHVTPNSAFLSYFTFGGDLFFSGHTGLPFLMALVFWRDKVLRYLFIACSIIFGVVVLLGHLHYTIDVASAFFITYTIYHLAQKFFKKDYELFHSDGSMFNSRPNLSQ